MSNIGSNGEIENEFQHDGTLHQTRGESNPEYCREYYRTHKELRKAYAKAYKETHKEDELAYRLANREARRSYSQKYDLEHKLQKRFATRKRKYNLTKEAYQILEFSQQGRCAICRKTPKEDSQEILHVDHNHETSVVRGLVCFSCNTKLGWYERNKEIITSYTTRGN